MSELPLISTIFSATMTMFDADGTIAEEGTARHVDYPLTPTQRTALQELMQKQGMLV